MNILTVGADVSYKVITLLVWFIYYNMIYRLTRYVKLPK